MLKYHRESITIQQNTQVALQETHCMFNGVLVYSYHFIPCTVHINNQHIPTFIQLTQLIHNVYISAVKIVLYHNRCAQFSYQWGEKILSYQNTYNNTLVCCMVMKHALLQNIHICRIYFPTRLIQQDIFTLITYRVPTNLAFISVPYTQVTNFNIPLGKKVIVLTWTCHMTQYQHICKDQMETEVTIHKVFKTVI